MIKKNGWLTKLELEEIKLKALNENICNEAEGTVDHGIVEGCRDENLNTSVIENSFDFEDNVELDGAERGMIKGINHIIDESLSRKFIGFEKIVKSILKGKVKKMNKVFSKIRMENLSGTNILLKACSIYVGEAIGIKPVKMRQRNNKEPWWKQQI